MNEAYLNKTYAENQLKCFRTQKIRAENVKKKEINLMKLLKDVEEFEEMTETVKKSFEKNFEMKKKDFDQIKKLKKDRRDAQDSSRNAVELINDENEVFKNNIINISFDYNVVEDAVVVVKTENETLRNIALRQNFRNEHIRKNAFDEDTKFSIE